MRLNHLILSLIAVLVSACSGGHEASHVDARDDSATTYDSVGLITYQNAPLCTGTIIKHGVFLTAKHCFRSRPNSGRALLAYSLNFPHGSTANHAPKFVTGDKIKGIILEGNTSDVAYILYDPAETLGSVPIDQTELNLTVPPAGTAAQLVGFPGPEKYLAGSPRLVSKNCKFTGKSGTLERTENDPGYDGTLYGTDCDAWFGESGGPVFVADPTTGLFSSLAGIVTHTFALMPNGSLDPSKIQVDGVGHYVADANISPLLQASRLADIMTMDLNDVPNASEQPAPSIDRLCGYASFAALMTEAKTAVSFLQNQTDFQPTFWIDGHPDFVTVALANMATKNKALVAARPTEVSQYSWASEVFERFDALRGIDALRNFRDKGVGQLGFTGDISDCEALECTNYFDFTVKLNTDAASDLFSRLGNTKASQDLYGVLGHEFGHYVLDNYYVASHLYASYADAHAKVAALKYHLTVDAIGMVLTSSGRDDFIAILRSAGTTSIMGQRRTVGDIGDRIECLTSLP